LRLKKEGCAKASNLGFCIICLFNGIGIVRDSYLGFTGLAEIAIGVITLPRRGDD
jgi:hypothetical protein